MIPTAFLTPTDHNTTNHNRTELHMCMCTYGFYHSHFFPLKHDDGGGLCMQQ